MERVRELLCPHIDMERVRKRAKLVYQQMGRTIHEPVVMEASYVARRCDLCGNEDEARTVLDDTQGTMICLGKDGLGCGCVMLENRWLEPRSSAPLVHDTTSDLYSPQHQFVCSTVKHHKYHRLVRSIEKNLSRYDKDDTVTSDMYKDDQRTEMYALLDRVEEVLRLDGDVVDRVKVLFHEFRVRMYRIHKLEMVLCCLFYMIYNPVT